jgi:hypothetical protein
MPVETPEGKPVDLSEFNKAMHEQQVTAASDEPMAPAPPRKDPDAPHGRTVSGAPKKAPGGRPPRHDKPRVSKTPVTQDSKPKDYTQTLAGTATAVWIAGSSVGPVKPYAALFKATSAGMVTAWNAAAQQNSQIRAVVDKLDSGEGGMWMLGVAVATVPFAMGCLELVKNPEARAMLAKQNDAEFEAWAKANVPGMIPEEKDSADAPAAHRAE